MLGYRGCDSPLDRCGKCRLPECREIQSVRRSSGFRSSRRLSRLAWRSTSFGGEQATRPVAFWTTLWTVARIGCMYSARRLRSSNRRWLGITNTRWKPKRGQQAAPPAGPRPPVSASVRRIPSNASAMEPAQPPVSVRRALTGAGWVYVGYHVLAVALGMYEAVCRYWDLPEFLGEVAVGLMFYPVFLPALTMCEGLHGGCKSAPGVATQVTVLGLNAGVTRNPFSPTWPLELLSTITFTAHGAKTTVTVRWTTLNPTEVEAKTFKDGHDSMRQGWTGTLDQLGDYLAKVRAEPSTNALGRRRLTLPSSGQPPACRWLPLMPIVRRLVICNVLGYTHRGDPRV